ncbi:MAG: nucleotidyltransferase family protein [Anaerolineae bacterium]|nr:nucleotidyltransferase family protein [Anaerolineae bacterium]
MMLQERIRIQPDELADFSRRHHIRSLSLFGSVLRDDFTPDSDIDVLVEFEPGAVVGFFELIDAQMELSDLLGRQVDLNTAGFLSPRFRERVQREAVRIYEGQPTSGTRASSCPQACLNQA